MQQAKRETLELGNAQETRHITYKLPPLLPGQRKAVVILLLRSGSSYALTQQRVCVQYRYTPAPTATPVNIAMRPEATCAYQLELPCCRGALVWCGGAAGSSEKTFANARQGAHAVGAEQPALRTLHPDAVATRGGIARRADRATTTALLSCGAPHLGDQPHGARYSIPVGDAGRE